MSRLSTSITPVVYDPPVTGKETLARLRERRRVERTLRQVADGNLREILLRISQHRFPVVQTNASKFSELLVKLNLVGEAMQMHAEILVCEPPMVTAPEGYEPQQAAINAIEERCAFELAMLRATEIVNVEGRASMMACSKCGAGGRGVVLEVQDNERCFPVGHLGPDGQPTAWERRWVIERPDPANPRKTIKVLRVESHWLPDGSPFAAVAQRAYLVESEDPLSTVVTEAKPYDLASVAPGVDPLTLLPTDQLDIAELVIGRRADGGAADAGPRPRLNPRDIDLVDSCTAILTRFVRMLDVHGIPKMRVPERAIDKNTGTLQPDLDTFVDPDKEIEYINNTANFAALMDAVDKLADYVLWGVRMARVLLGVPSKEGATPHTYGELALNAQTTLAAAKGAARHFTRPLQRLWTVACWIESTQPGGGFDVERVSVRFSPGLFQSFGDIVTEQRDALEAGLTSRRRALKRLHGDDADKVLAEIEADEERKADLAAKSVMADMGGLHRSETGATAEGNNGGDGSASGDAGGDASTGGVS